MRPQEDSSDLDADMEQVSRRYPFLLVLEDGPLSRGQLAERLDVSRATVHRATESLLDLGLVEEFGRGLALTTLGTVALVWERNTRQAMAASQRLAPVLEHVDSELFLENLHRFADAEVLVDDQRKPMRIENRLVKSIDDTDRFRRATN